MVKIIQDEHERIGRLGKVIVGCIAVVFDQHHQKILLTRRRDNGRWCLPGGRMEAGETVKETCIRELKEETGLGVEITKLVGVYSDPNMLLEYPDGNRYHLVGLCFEAKPVHGELILSNETTEFGYFTPAEIEEMDLLEHHRIRIHDTLTNKITTFVK